MLRFRDLITRTYLSFDPRSLALFRVVFGLVLIFDLYTHWRVVDLWYIDAGLLPGQLVLDHPPTRRVFSLFFAASSPGAVQIGMAICALVYLSFLLGWKTRLSQVLAFVCLVSLNGRIALLQNGGDTVLNLLCMWTLFLPLGRRFSLDALFRSMREHDEHVVQDLEDRSAIAPDNRPAQSLAVLALLLQLACIYYFSAVQKNGFTWLEGTAVHYALHQDKIVTVFGLWLRESFPQPLLALLGYATMLVEVLAPLWLLSPVWTRQMRWTAIAALAPMHLAFALCLNIGTFSYAMISYLALLPCREDWEALTAWLRGRRPRRVVYFDADCGICFQAVRIAARLDGFQRLRFVSNRDTASLPDWVTQEVTDTTVLVKNDSTGRVLTQSAAVAEVFRAIPLGRLVAAPMGLPILRVGLDRFYDWVSRNRTEISQRLGLNACGTPLAAAGSSGTAPPAAQSRFGFPALGRELLVALMLVASTGQILHDNFVVPRSLRYRQPEFLQLLIDYPRLLQGWRLFTPEGPPEDAMISVEAVTADGREVDPFNELASRQKTPRFDAIPNRLGQDRFFWTYSNYAALGDLIAYYPALTRWILDYPERTGNPRDRIERFELVKIFDISPAPGRSRPTNIGRQVLFRYPPDPADDPVARKEER